MSTLLLTLFLNRSEAQTAQDAADHALSKLLYTDFLCSPFAAERHPTAVYGAFDNGAGHAWLTGVIREPWTAPRIAPWALTSERSRQGLPTLPAELMPSNAWRIEARVPLPQQTFATVTPPRDALARAFADWCSGSVRAISVYTQQARWDCVARRQSAYMTNAMLASRTQAAPCAFALRGSLLFGLCLRYAKPDVFGWEQIARVCTALKHCEDRVLTTRDLEIVLWNALPRPLTNAALTAFDLPLDTPLRVDDRTWPSVGCAVPGVLTGCFSDLSHALTGAYVPNRGNLGSATFSQAEADNYFRLAEGLATHPNTFVETVCESWDARGIDLNPPSTHRMEGLMP